MPDRVTVEDVLLLARRADDAGQYEADSCLYAAAVRTFDLGRAPGEPMPRRDDKLSGYETSRRGALWATALLIEPR